MNLRADVKEPYPGSPEAAKAGCICNPEINKDGRGILVHGKNVFMVDMGCPLHGELLKGAIIAGKIPRHALN